MSKPPIKETPVYTGVVRMGKFIPDNLEWFTSGLNAFENRSIAVYLTEKKGLRSLKMNNYYWGVVVPLLARHLEENNLFANPTIKRVHNALKSQFLGLEEVMQLDGTIKDETISTSSLNNRQYCNFLESIWAYCSITYALHIPEPDPDWRDKKYKLLNADEIKIFYDNLRNGTIKILAFEDDVYTITDDKKGERMVKVLNFDINK